MKLLSALGSTEFFLLALPLCYWCFNRRIGWQVGLVVVANAIVNDLLKVTFALPRPYWVSPAVHQWDKDLSFGLPSGHVQGAVVFWIFLALQIEDRRMRHLALGGACGLCALIAISRMYLGVHFPADAAAGALFGIGFLAVFLSLLLPWGKRFRSFEFSNQLMLALAIPLVAFALFVVALQLPHSGEASGYAKWLGEARGASSIAGRSGALAGLMVGLVLMGREQRFSVEGPRGKVILRCLVGLLVVAVLYQGLAIVLKAITPQGATAITEIGRFGRYFVLAWWISAGAPALFLKLGWMRREEPFNPLGRETPANSVC